MRGATALDGKRPALLFNSGGMEKKTGVKHGSLVDLIARI